MRCDRSERKKSVAAAQSLHVISQPTVDLARATAALGIARRIALRSFGVAGSCASCAILTHPQRLTPTSVSSMLTVQCGVSTPRGLHQGVSVCSARWTVGSPPREADLGVLSQVHCGLPPPGALHQRVLGVLCQVQ